MTIRQHTTLLLTFATVGLLLQGCGPKVSGPGTRLFEADFKGAAKSCDSPKATTTPGMITESTMKMGSDGGWCGLSTSNGGRPFDTERLTARPEHGKVYVHRVGNDTRMDYTPDAGYAGTDSFTVQLLPGEASVHVTVTSTPR